jgi:hypothetical protein
VLSGGLRRLGPGHGRKIHPGPGPARIRQAGPAPASATAPPRYLPNHPPQGADGRSVTQYVLVTVLLAGPGRQGWNRAPSERSVGMRLIGRRPYSAAISGTRPSITDATATSGRSPRLLSDHQPLRPEHKIGVLVDVTGHWEGTARHRYRHH